MPSKKRKEFDAISLEIPFRQLELNMFEVSETYKENINQILLIVDEGTKAITEVTGGEEPEVLEVFRSLPDTFTVRNRRTEEENHYKPHEFLNWVYATAPFMVMVGRPTNN